MLLLLFWTSECRLLYAKKTDGNMYRHSYWDILIYIIIFIYILLKLCVWEKTHLMSVLNWIGIRNEKKLYISREVLWMMRKCREEDMEESCYLFCHFSRDPEESYIDEAQKWMAAWWWVVEDGGLPAEGGEGDVLVMMVYRFGCEDTLCWLDEDAEKMKIFWDVGRIFSLYFSSIIKGERKISFYFLSAAFLSCSLSVYEILYLHICDFYSIL